MTPGILAVFTLVGAVLPLIGHWVGSRAATPAPATPVAPADPFANLPGFTGHPFLNLLTHYAEQQAAQQQQQQQAAVALAQIAAAHPAAAVAPK